MNRINAIKNLFFINLKRIKRCFDLYKISEFFFFFSCCQGPSDKKLIWNIKNKNNLPLELSKTETKREKKRKRISDSGKSMSLAAEECEEMEFKIGQKRSRKEQYTEALLKKNKREES